MKPFSAFSGSSAGISGRVRRIVLVGDRHQRPHHHHGLAGMRVREHDAVRARHVGQVSLTGREALCVLAVGRAVLGHRLIEAHGRAAAAVAEQHDLSDAGLAAQEFDAGLHVERDLVPAHLHLVVGEARVHAQHQEAAARELGAAGVREIVRGAMDDDDADMRRRPAVRLVERGRSRREANEQRIALRLRGHCKAQQHARKNEDAERHRRLPIDVLIYRED